VALRQDSFGELKVPLTWMAVVALIVCGVVGVSILLSDRRETFQTEAYGVARQAVDTVSAPVGGAVAAPGRWTGTRSGSTAKPAGCVSPAAASWCCATSLRANSTSPARSVGHRCCGCPLTQASASTLAIASRFRPGRWPWCAWNPEKTPAPTRRHWPRRQHE